MDDERPAISQEPTGNDDGYEEPSLAAGFSVVDDASANWVIRQVIERRLYASRCEQWCEREKRRAKKDEEFFLFRYGMQLAGYVRKCIAEQRGRRKSINLPAGIAGFRTEAEKVIIEDDEAVITWAKAHQPDLVATAEKVKKDELNRHIERTGEVPDSGIRIEPAREKFYIK